MTQHSLNDKWYRFHRLALLPLLPDASEGELVEAGTQLAATDQRAFADFLVEQGLASMWDSRLNGSDVARKLAPSLIQRLRQVRLNSTAAYLVQRNSLYHAKAFLEAEGIQHVVYKGASLRERLYEEPALRPAEDIDILVPDKDKAAAIRLFRRQGFSLITSAANISHEIGLNLASTAIDLHWDILRPGRTRIPMTQSLLASRRDYGSHWGLSNESSVFVALVHPVFVRYSTAPQAVLMRVVDLARLLNKLAINWDAVMALLNQSGLRTAAWITLKWYEQLTSLIPPAEFMAAIQPGRLRQKYLSHWLANNYSSRFLTRPTFVKLGFTLPAHDRWEDATRVLRSTRALRKSQQNDLQNLLNCSEA